MEGQCRAIMVRLQKWRDTARHTVVGDVEAISTHQKDISDDIGKEIMCHFY